MCIVVKITNLFRSFFDHPYLSLFFLKELFLVLVCMCIYMLMLYHPREEYIIVFIIIEPKGCRPEGKVIIN